jgi:hypothetical protein
MDEKRKRGGIALLVIPLLAAIAAASRGGANMRTVDFIRVFASGMCFGVVLMGVMQFIRERKKSTA